MSITTRLNRRITQLAVGRHLPHRTVRIRLTLLYGGLFLVSGTVLLAVAWALFVNATGFVVTGQDGWSTTIVNGHAVGLTRSVPASVSRLHQQYPKLTAAQILRMFQATSSQANQAAEQGALNAVGNREHDHVLRYLALESGIALAVMSLLSLGVGWLMAGRVLEPLEDSYRAQRQFVANASHELRAPLTRQRALIQVALADPQASFSSLRAAHERVLASERHLEQMIDGLLALTRGQAGLERREPFDLSTLAGQVLRTRASENTNLGLDIRAKLDPAPTAGDPRLVERLIANLVDNAIRHNVPNGHVEITTGMRHQRAFLAIANSGAAIPPAELPRLLQPFQRLDGTRTTHGSGTGLGLAIVNAIALAHDATLTTRPGSDGGLSVDVTFPAAGLDAAQINAATQGPALGSPRGAPTRA
jgi:signal transduction histidine kinase